MVEELLREIIVRFNKLVEEDPKLKKEAEDKVRTIQFVFDEGSAYHFVLDRGHIEGLNEGGAEEADISIMCTEETLRAIYSGELSAMKAYAMKKLRLKASLQDLLTLRKFF